MNISDCPFCGKTPEPYDTEGLDRRGPDPHAWYVHCRDEDRHTDDLTEMGLLDENEHGNIFTKHPDVGEAVFGAYGHDTLEEAAGIWNKFVETVPPDVIICYQLNCHNGTVLFDWAGARANGVEPGVQPCPNCRKEEWKKLINS